MPQMPKPSRQPDARVPGTSGDGVPSTTRPGRRVAGYIPVAPLRRGGMGETALAFKDLPHGKRCWAVIKRPLAGLADDVEFRKRFLHEALVATMVQHRSVVHLEASGEDL